MVVSNSKVFLDSLYIPMHKISNALLKWYRIHRRTLPWRGETDPYLVWVSEIMLQQTRVETVIHYYLKWKERFPTLQSLALASEEDVLLLWEGLGYYSRARNLHSAAQLINEQMGGKMPQDITQLRSLPGIGEYTAHAIASICFNVPVIALDANIKRIFARLLDLEDPVTSPSSKASMKELGERLLHEVNAGDLNQAFMDLGSLVCLSGNPVCTQCPLNRSCISYKNGTPAERPVVTKKKGIPTYRVVAAAIQKESGLFLLAKRPKGGLLAGLWEFPGGKVEMGEDDAAALVREIHEELNTTITVGSMVGEYRHAYTHFKVVVRAFLCEITGPDPQAVEAQKIKWVPCERMQNFAMGKVDRQITHALCNIETVHF